MSEEEFEEYYKKIEPNFNSKIEKGTIEMSNEYYNAIEERMARLINKNNNLQNQLQQKENIIKEIKAQLEYLETYSSKEDVYEDMSRRLNNIEKIINKENK